MLALGFVPLIQISLTKENKWPHKFLVSSRQVKSFLSHIWQNNKVFVKQNSTNIIIVTWPVFFSCCFITWLVGLFLILMIKLSNLLNFPVSFFSSVFKEIFFYLKFVQAFYYIFYVYTFWLFPRIPLTYLRFLLVINILLIFSFMYFYWNVFCMQHRIS